MASRLHLVRVTAILGRGNLTETLVADVAARRGGTPRSTVVKRLHPNLATDQAAMARIVEEARVLARLKHPLVPAFLGVGDDHGLPFFAQELIDGTPIQEGTTVSWEETLAVVLDVADALAHAHAQGVIHRDLSRRNLLLDSAGRTHLIDFGVARADDRPQLTRTGAVIGTPSAMAPEQALGHAPHATVDVWALGTIGYGLLTGRHPLGIESGDSPTTRLLKAREAAPAPIRGDGPNVALAGLQALLMDCLQREPARRPPEGQALLARLKGVPISQAHLVRARGHLEKRAAGWLSDKTLSTTAWPETLDD